MKYYSVLKHWKAVVVSGLEAMVYLGLAVNRSFEPCLLLSYWHAVMLIQSTCSFRCLFWKDTWKNLSLGGVRSKRVERYCRRLQMSSSLLFLSGTLLLWQVCFLTIHFLSHLQTNTGNSKPWQGFISGRLSKIPWTPGSHGTCILLRLLKSCS